MADHDDPIIAERFRQLDDVEPPDVWPSVQALADAKARLGTEPAGRRPRRALAAVGACAVLLGALGLAFLARVQGDDTASQTVAGPRAPIVGAFDGLEPGWHELDTGPVPPSTASISWTGEELLVAGGGRLFAYDPGSDRWRERPRLPFDDDATLSVTAMNGPILAVAVGNDGVVESAVLGPGQAEWQELGRVPNGFAEAVPGQRGPSDANGRNSLIWTGERAIDLTDGAVFDPVTTAWSTVPLPEDIVAYTHLLFANPVLAGGEVVLAYPHSLPVLAYDGRGTSFREFAGMDESLLGRANHIGLAYTVGLDGDVFAVRDGGLAARYVTASHEWELLPPVPGVVTPSNDCPGRVASLGDSVVVAPCYGETPLRLVDGRWEEIDATGEESCCQGLWLGVDGVLVVWDSDIDTANNPEAPYVRAMVWVPPHEGD